MLLSVEKSTRGKKLKLSAIDYRDLELVVYLHFGGCFSLE